MINVVIQSLADVRAGKSLLPGLDPSHIQPATTFTVGILQAGTLAGKTSLAFLLSTPDGGVVTAECTAGEFEMLAGAVRGAVARFGDEASTN